MTRLSHTLTAAYAAGTNLAAYPRTRPRPSRTSCSRPCRPADPKFQERMKQLGTTVLTSDTNPQALDAKVRQQVPQWKKLFTKAGVEKQ